MRIRSTLMLALAVAAHSAFASSPTITAGQLLAMLEQPVLANQERRPLQKIGNEEVKRWENLGPANISPDGRWVSFQLVLDNADGKLVLRNSDTPQTWETPVGSGLAFSDDSKWAAYRIGVPKDEAEKLRQQQRPVETKLGLRNLADGKEQVFDSVRSHRFLKGGRFLLMHKFAKRPGADLVVHDLSNGQSLTIGNVVGFALNKSETVMAIQYESDSGEKGVQLFDPANGVLRTVRSGKETISNLGFAAKSDVLAFLSGKDDPKKDGAWNKIVVVQNPLGAGVIGVVEYDPATDDKFPKGSRIAEFGGLRMNEAGTSFAFGIKAWEDKKAPSNVKPEDKPGVDIWHSKDVEVMPLQKSQAGQERMRTLAAIWRPSGGFVQLGTEAQPAVSVLGQHEYAIIADEKPYRTPIKAGGLDYADYWLWDLKDGSKTKVLSKRQFPLFASPDGQRSMYWSQGDWWLFDHSTKKAMNVTSKLGVTFKDEEYDGPQAETPPVSMPSWLNRSTPVIYDMFDAWVVNDAGSARPLTSGRKDQIVYRLTDIGMHEDGLRIQDPLYFNTFGKWSKMDGVYRREPDGSGKMLFFDNVEIAGFRKSKDTDRMIFRMESNVASPNLFVTNTLFSAAKPVSKTNPWQSEYFWPKTELLDFKTKSGWNLQGVLTYPANYQPGRQYPMIVTFYERVSDGLNGYPMPMAWDPYNVQMFSQMGFFVLQPDITYRTNDPGRSATECLEAATNAALAKRVGIDPFKVGLTGHSWGGYQTAFVFTQSKMFKAAAAGAPLTDMLSMYNNFYWNWGETNQVIFESSQGRFNKPWWEIPDDYIRNSPIWSAKNIAGPFMMLFGNADGAVDWSQGYTYYNTLRRMGKDVILVVYEGENHFPNKRANQLDFAHRVRHFFDVHLNNAKPEPWVTEGLPFLQKP